MEKSQKKVPGGKSKIIPNKTPKEISGIQCRMNPHRNFLKNHERNLWKGFARVHVKIQEKSLEEFGKKFLEDFGRNRRKIFERYALQNSELNIRDNLPKRNPWKYFGNNPWKKCGRMPWKGV